MDKLTVIAISLSLSFCSYAKPYPKTRYEKNIELMRHQPTAFRQMSWSNIHKLAIVAISAQTTCQESKQGEELCLLYSAGIIGCMQAQFVLLKKDTNAEVANQHFGKRLYENFKQCVPIANKQANEYLKSKGRK